MLSFALFSKIGNIPIPNGGKECTTDQLIINSKSYDDNCRLNPHAEPFMSYTLTRQYGLSAPVNLNYNDNVCTDYFNKIPMRDTCPNAVNDLTSFPQVMSFSAFSIMLFICFFLNLEQLCSNNTYIVAERCVLDQLREKMRK